MKRFTKGQKVIAVDSNPSDRGGVPAFGFNKQYTIQKVDESLEDVTYMLSNGWWYREDQISKCIGTAILRTSTKGFRFNLVAANNEKIATSEVYTTKAMALKTIRKYFPDFEIVDKTKPRAK